MSPKDGRGVVIKLGGRIQGIIARRQKENQSVVEVERWLCKNRDATQQSSAADSRDTQSTWSRDVRSNARLPKDWLCAKDRSIGDKFEYDGLTWRISEVHA